MVFEEIQHIVYRDILEKLPSHLTYHNLEHTNYVLSRAIYLAEKTGITAKEMELLKLAALFHDTGFIDNPKDHEEKGCKIAEGYLSKDYSKEDLEKIYGMIMATKIPQSPTNDLENILADADLEYLGTDLFEQIGETLFIELKHFNPNFTERAWDELQLVFMEKHHYHTKYCQVNREPKKQENLLKVKKRLGLD
ncbi:HD domain-containing protein [Algoriphagus boseongensis]|uniref:HD domain-containing protein n=1 Tax=Algoriphagus boseongensis TaxID=1442587 RepID=A0A4R6T7B3_9BACT|nr:HD domain-containing protein [Algoriphagus boseongensis]TDQ17115.1 HD domain-containing protein [Algoriphagus boseongensis]